ncbi:thioredoxin family protein [Zoogloea sp.]|uniref:thioredoxin family protein n=1 Tax=Zoogloea sp. TaxID=49181 RepID=UPI00260DBFF4|nr:thioredoxin family protein [Zoogloea sp.]MDD3353805.1 thioredoxin family protein [Zoogloea sp.]
MSPPCHDQEFFIACLCAAWCGTCRDYRAGFDALAARYPDARFLWVDVEDEAELVDDYDVENFPTLLIQRHDSVLFFGTMLPHHDLLQRTLERFRAQAPEESRHYACSDPLRAGWQDTRNLRRALAGRDDHS